MQNCGKCRSKNQTTETASIGGWLVIWHANSKLHFM